MDGPSPRFMDVFFEVFEALPRQGPGSRECTARAFALCEGLPASPAVLDLGCGAGAQTFHLAALTAGTITAVDRHGPLVARLRRTVAASGAAGRVRPVIADIASLPFAPESFDLVWSEGAFYNVGIEEALRGCRGLLRPGGCVAFTDAVWLGNDPPPEVREAFADYPGMSDAEGVAAAVGRSGFELLGRFTLPDEAWWGDFYGPMENVVAELRAKYAEDREALAALDELAREPAMHRAHADTYAYEFFVARRAGRGDR